MCRFLTASFFTKNEINAIQIDVLTYSDIKRTVVMMCDIDSDYDQSTKDGVSRPPLCGELSIDDIPSDSDLSDDVFIPDDTEGAYYLEIHGNQCFILSPGASRDVSLNSEMDTATTPGRRSKPCVPIDPDMTSMESRISMRAQRLLDSDSGAMSPLRRREDELFTKYYSRLFGGGHHSVSLSPAGSKARSNSQQESPFSNRSHIKLYTDTHTDTNQNIVKTDTSKSKGGGESKREDTQHPTCSTDTGIHRQDNTGNMTDLNSNINKKEGISQENHQVSSLNIVRDENEVKARVPQVSQTDVKKKKVKLNKANVSSGDCNPGVVDETNTGHKSCTNNGLELKHKQESKRKHSLNRVGAVNRVSSSKPGLVKSCSVSGASSDIGDRQAKKSLIKGGGHRLSPSLAVRRCVPTAHDSFSSSSCSYDSSDENEYFVDNDYTWSSDGEQCSGNDKIVISAMTDETKLDNYRELGRGKRERVEKLSCDKVSGRSDKTVGSSSSDISGNKHVIELDNKQVSRDKRTVLSSTATQGNVLTPRTAVKTDRCKMNSGTDERDVFVEASFNLQWNTESTVSVEDLEKGCNKLKHTSELTSEKQGEVSVCFNGAEVKKSKTRKCRSKQDTVILRERHAETPSGQRMSEKENKPPPPRSDEGSKTRKKKKVSRKQQTPTRRNKCQSVFTQTVATVQCGGPQGLVDKACQACFSDDSDFEYEYYSSGMEDTHKV